MKHGLLLLALICITTSIQAQSLDKLFKAPDRQAKNSSTSSVMDGTDSADGDLQNRADEVQERQGRMRSGSTSTGSGSRSVDASAAWKLLKTYDGGFAEFGFDHRSTIYVVRCRSGSEIKIYRDKKVLWGTVGLGWNNSSSTFEDAANKYCK